MLLLDVQSDLIDELSTRMVIPLLPMTGGPSKVDRLHPVLNIDGRDYLLATNLMAAVERSSLKQVKANMLSRHDDISRAVYMLFQGF